MPPPQTWVLGRRLREDQPLNASAAATGKQELARAARSRAIQDNTAVSTRERDGRAPGVGDVLWKMAASSAGADSQSAQAEDEPAAGNAAADGRRNPEAGGGAAPTRVAGPAAATKHRSLAISYIFRIFLGA
jgi:hypothetical protein